MQSPVRALLVDDAEVVPYGGHGNGHGNGMARGPKHPAAPAATWSAPPHANGASDHSFRKF